MTVHHPFSLFANYDMIVGYVEYPLVEHRIFKISSKTRALAQMTRSFLLFYCTDIRSMIGEDEEKDAIHNLKKPFDDHCYSMRSDLPHSRETVNHLQIEF